MVCVDAKVLSSEHGRGNIGDENIEFLILPILDREIYFGLKFSADDNDGVKVENKALANEDVKQLVTA
jgi:hypothetical protein